MELSRRRFLQGVAVAPLATLPSIVLAQAPVLMPTPDQVLKYGSQVTMPETWKDEEMKVLLTRCASLLRKECNDINYPDLSQDFHDRADNALVFSLDIAGVTHSVFFAVTALTGYQLPMTPGKMSSFDEFHKRCGDQICRATDHNGTENQVHVDWFQNIRDESKRLTKLIA